jgi:hypothetical protein
MAGCRSVSIPTTGQLSAAQPAYRPGRPAQLAGWGPDFKTTPADGDTKKPVVSMRRALFFIFRRFPVLPAVYRLQKYGRFCALTGRDTA